jgi:hypothetical protein
VASLLHGPSDFLVATPAAKNPAANGNFWPPQGLNKHSPNDPSF